MKNLGQRTDEQKPETQDNNDNPIAIKRFIITPQIQIDLFPIERYELLFRWGREEAAESHARSGAAETKPKSACAAEPPELFFG
jgi:hypothetical protein